MDDIQFTYTGDGTFFIDGVPARDLTAADVAALPAALRAAVKRSPLYEAAAQSKPVKASRRKRAPEIAEEAPADETGEEPAAVAAFWTTQEGE